MRRGMNDKLKPEDTSQVTISFSSMSRWQVMRHVPVLPPHTSLIVAHTGSSNDIAALGATYDHRVLTGGEVAAVLRSLREPPK
jgi:pyruvate dehydrogenase E2 component (dihydrolipoamide acetyltransferase)